MNAAPPPPATVAELVERLTAITRDSFLKGWLEDPGRLPAAEESMTALRVWDYLTEAGLPQPDWVSAAHAAGEYSRRGLL